jgi:23S rRNA (adenine1618-N6)-methyltransferase
MCVCIQGRIHWYTSMVGKKGTLRALRQRLQSVGVTAVRTTELTQGRTSRWVLAWSFSARPTADSTPLPRPGPLPSAALPPVR